MGHASTAKVPAIILGAYGTGTNWMVATLRKSGVSLYSKAGIDRDTGELVRHFFKHYVIEPDTLEILRPPSNALFVCLVKSPLFWILSLERMLSANRMQGPMRKLCGLGLSSLVRAPATMVSARREITDGATLNATDLPDLWNRYAAGYLRRLPRERTHIVPYELAVRDPDACFHPILDRVGIAREALVIHTERRMKIGHDLAEARAYYADDRNRLAPFAEADIDFVQQRIDGDLLTAMGYEPDGSTRTIRQPA